MIKLKNYGNKVKDLRSFRKDSLSALGESLYSLPKKDEFLFQIFQNIDATNKILKKDSSQLEKCCETVLNHFGILNLRTTVAYNSSTGKVISSGSDKKSVIEKFFHYILELNPQKLPSQEFQELEELVKSDLNQITKLMAWYESDPFIQEVIKKGIKPRDHEQRILHDFYKRCQLEQSEVLNYYLNGIKKRALSNAYYIPATMNALFSIGKQFKDRPYKFAFTWYDPYFDCRKIDVISHRTEEMELEIDEVKAIKLYKENKAKFYRLIFKKNPPAGIFQSISFYLSQLPLYDDRKPLFDELRILFNAKKWFGFYALALTQIEGLFSEMFRLAFPGISTGKKSLSDKVESVRPFYRISVYYLDYYQYQLPRLRNKFMHSGYDENLKEKSYDLLLDLLHLLRIFHGMDNPVVKIKKLHANRNYAEFITYKDFASYFTLLAQLKTEQARDLDTNIVEFEKEFLLPYCNVQYISLEVIQNLPKTFSDFNQNLINYSHRIGEKLNFETMDKNQIRKVINEGNIIEELATSFRIRSDDLETLNAYQIFLLGYKKYLPSLDKEIITQLSVLSGNFLSKLSLALSTAKKVKLIDSKIANS